ncbi:MAG: arylesterase [Campylobacteraceae bacterium]|nr:arylesterase [Campylobacteraceae bacterium]
MKKWILLAGAIVIALVIITKTDAKIEIPQNAVILAFGDSLTEGYGAKEDESYPVRLGKILNMQVINAGISGEVTQKGAARLPSLLDEIKPDIVILCHGGNDIIRKYDLQKTKQNLAYMINLIRNKNAVVILVGVPSFNGFLIDTNDIYDELADEYNLIYEDAVLSEIIKSPALKYDQIHPNAAGYGLMAENLAKLFNKYFNIADR